MRFLPSPPKFRDIRRLLRTLALGSRDFETLVYAERARVGEQRGGEGDGGRARVAVYPHGNSRLYADFSAEETLSLTDWVGRGKVGRVIVPNRGDRRDRAT